MSSTIKRNLLLAVWLMSSWYGSAISGQAPPAPAEEDPPAAPEGVYLDDSFEAAELLTSARAAAERSDWPLALEHISELLRNHDSKVVSTDDKLFTSVVREAMAMIAAWPEPGLAAYQDLFEPAARSALGSAEARMDPGQLARIIDTYFCTSVALDAASMLAEMHFDAGDFERAAALYARLLSEHPQRSIVADDLQARLAVAIAAGGDAALSYQYLETVGTRIGDVELPWKGTRATCRSIIESFEDSPIAPRGGSHRQADVFWPMFGGSARHARIPDMPALPSAPLWIFEGFNPTTLDHQDGFFQGSSYRAALERGKFLALQPIVAGGHVLLQDARRVWAVNQDSGEVAWTYEAFPDSNDSNWQDRSVPALLCSTAQDAMIYAVLGNRPSSYYGYQPTPTQSLLVALDADSGRPQWRVSPQAFGEDPREVQFEGPVIADRTGVYTVVRRRKAFGFEDCYVWKIDTSGNLRWQVHVGSAATGGFGYRRPTLAIPTLIAGTVYVQSNLGTVAAIDALSGLIQWISIYQQDPAQEPEAFPDGSIQSYSWNYNPITLVPGGSRQWGLGGRLAVLPLDRRELLLLDRARGHVVRRIPCSELEDATCILGLIGGRLYTVGQRALCWDIREERAVWTRDLPDSPLYGRGALSSQHMFIPCRKGLASFAVADGQMALHPWNAVEEGGNVVALDNQILVAGNDRLTAYGLRDRVFTRLRERMDEAPMDPLAALELAEVAFRTAATQQDTDAKRQDYARGRAALEQAIDRAGGFAGAMEPELRNRLFNDCLQFARYVNREDPPDLKAAETLLMTAGECAPDAASLLLQKARLAEVYGLIGTPDRQIMQYHRILSDRSLRDLPWPEDDGDEQPAHQVARARIDQLIADHGRAPYAHIDDIASSKLAAAIAIGDIERLTGIHQTMPNALAAPQALLACGRILMDQEAYTAAARHFYAALLSYPEAISSAEVIHQLADAYLHAGRPEAAWSWLTRGAREFPDDRIMVDGKPVTLAMYRSMIVPDGRPPGPRHPHLRPELDGRYDIAISAGGRLLRPQIHDDATVWTHMIVHRNRSIDSFDSVTADHQWSTAVEGDATVRLLWSTATNVVVATPFEVLGLDATSGAVQWRYGALPAGIDDVQADHESFPTWTAHAGYGRYMVSLRDDGLAICWDAHAGVLHWQRELTQRPADALIMTEQLIIYTARQGAAEPRAVVLDISDGRPLRSIDLAGRSPILALHATLAGNVVLCTARSLTAVDPFSGQREWHRDFGDALRVHTIRITVDGVVLSPDGERVIKLNLGDGTTVWTSEQLARRGSSLGLITATEALYTLTDRVVTALDPVSGQTLATVSPPRGATLVRTVLAHDGVALVFRTPSGEEDAADYWTYMTQRPFGSDRVLDPAEAESLGVLRGLIEFHVYRDAIIGVSPGTLSGWTNQTTDTP